MYYQQNTMQKTNYLLLILSIFTCILCSGQSKKETHPNGNNYLFFLHNRFVEENDLDVKHPEYGKAEYLEIITSFKKDGFIVLSEKRKKNTDVKKYAEKIVTQIDSLLQKGVQPNHITVVGTSKGGYIAQYVATFMANPDVNFVFIGSFRESDIENYPQIQFCGNILTIYEKSDEFGVSAVQRKKNSTLKINTFREIELNTNLKHGFLFQPLPEWIEPCKMWAKRNYTFDNQTIIKH
ncbi:dienelactone hydrolase family protein [Flavobacterium sp. GCM10023249]